MKKTVLKIFATTTAVISLFFIVFTILTSLGKVSVEEFDNSIVRTICLVLGAVFVGLTVTMHVLLYLNDDAIKEIVLRTGKEGTSKTSLAVIKKITKNTIKNIEGVKCTKCAVVSNDFGIRLKVWVSVKNRDMKETEELVRACLEDAIYGALEFRFFAIDVYLKKIKAKHAVDKAAIEQKLAEKKAEEHPAEETPTVDAETESQQPAPINETSAVEENDETSVQQNAIDDIPAENEENPEEKETESGETKEEITE